jgi:PAS domain S-box-containing protein
MPTDEQEGAKLEHSLERLEHEEKKLWRLVLLFLGFIAVALAAATWDNLRSLPERLEAVPLGAVVLVALFAAYAYHKKREIAELRGMVRGFQAGASRPPTDAQIEKLTGVIAQSQRGYRDLIDSFDDIIFSLELDGTVRAANTAFARLLDVPFVEVVGHRLEEFLEEPRAAEVEKNLSRFLETRYWAGLVPVRFRKTGALRYFDCALHAILRDGQVVGISALARDVTEQHERETRFTGLFESLQEGAYFTTPEGQILDANAALVRMLGYSSREELLSRNAAELHWDPAEREQGIRAIEEHGVVREREIRLRRKDGKQIICLDSARAVWDAGGRRVRYQGTLVDITVRREIEHRLYQEQEFRHRLIDSFPDLIIVLDPQGRITYVSPRLRELLGYEPESLIGTHVSDPAAHSYTPEFEKLFQNLMAGKEPCASAEYPAQHKDGSWRTMRASASPLFDAEGKIAGVVASVRDVTPLKQLEQQLIQSEKMAAMGQMIDGFAHELNNPLTAILGAVELLGEPLQDEAARRKFQLLQQQARRAAEIVQNLLFFSRPPQPGKARLKLPDLVQRSLQLHEHSLRMNQITVDFLSAPDLPPVLGDPNQLMQVFLSLVINAEQAIREVRQQGTVRVRINNRGENISVVFQDDGPGFHPEVLPRIFDPFFTTKRPGRGAGLGLSISMAILKKYGGAITAENAPGGGALITVSLPVERQAKAAAVN